MPRYKYRPRLIIKKGGMLVYHYLATPECGFEFNTLAEVGQPFQPAFREIIKQRGLIVEFGRELDERSWVADFVVGREKSQPKGIS